MHGYCLIQHELQTNKLHLHIYIVSYSAGRSSGCASACASSTIHGASHEVLHMHTWTHPFHMHIDIATIIQNAWVVCASTCQSCKSYAVVCAHVYKLACVAVAWLVTWYTLNDSKTRVYDKRAWACACARGYFNCFLALITTCVIPPREIMLRLAWTTTALHDTRVKAPPDHELTYTAPAVADSKLHTSHTRPPRKLGS